MTAPLVPVHYPQRWLRAVGFRVLLMAALAVAASILTCPTVRWRQPAGDAGAGGRP